MTKRPPVPNTLAPASAQPSGIQSDPDPHRLARVARFKQLTEHTLPERARQQRWPIRLDHCFKRICLDHAYGDVWYNHLPRPAERHLQGEPLLRAVACAEALAQGDRALLDKHNIASLRWRGKLREMR